VAIVTLFCADTPGLHLGPGLPGSNDVIDFAGGYAELDTDDPDFARKISWVNSFGSPYIRILDTGEVPDTTPGSVTCPVCGANFGTDKSLNGHILGAHRKKG
jgi:hypothetical protein